MENEEKNSPQRAQRIQRKNVMKKNNKKFLSFPSHTTHLIPNPPTGGWECTGVE